MRVEINPAVWAGLGVAATLLCALIAQHFGFLQISLMRKAHEFNVVKAAPRIGCDVNVEFRNTLGPGYNPHLFLIFRIYNEGELAIQNLNGQWRYLPKDISQKKVFAIGRDFLGRCENYEKMHMIQESANWRKEGIAFDVDVEFFYLIPGEIEARRYFGQYYYFAKTEQMVRRSYD